MVIRGPAVSSLATFTATVLLLHLYYQTQHRFPSDQKLYKDDVLTHLKVKQEQGLRFSDLSDYLKQILHGC